MRGGFLATVVVVTVLGGGEARVLAAAQWSGEAEVAGRLPSGLREASGLAASRREAGLYWAHDDSGGRPVLKAFGADGRLRGALRIAGVKNVDWEDLASFELDGKAWLLVADTGDNRAVRGDCVLHVVEEPAAAELRPDVERVVPVAWSLPVIFPDGPRDVEAVAVDARAERVYLLEKRARPHGLHAMSLRPPPRGRAASPPERVGEVADFASPRAGSSWWPVAGGAVRAQPTAMDFAADGSSAVVSTYGEVLLYPRIGDEPWARVLGRGPAWRAGHGLPQAEAVAFSKDGAEILVTSEGAGAPILRWRRSGAKLPIRSDL